VYYFISDAYDEGNIVHFLLHYGLLVVVFSSFLGIPFWVWVKGNKQGKWIFISFTSYGLLNALCLILMKLTIGFFATIIEHVLLAFSLANVINTKKKILSEGINNHLITEYELNLLKGDLENRVKNRTKKLASEKDALFKTIQSLESTQKELIEVQKMAELGKLMEQISVQTQIPLKKCFGLITRIILQLSQLDKLMKSKKLKKTDLDTSLLSLGSYIPNLLVHLKESSEIIQTFKKIAPVDGTNEMSIISLGEYLNSLITSFYSSETNLIVEVKSEDNLTIESYQNLLYQILIQLVDNAKEHAFDNVRSPHVVISTEKQADGVAITISDNGNGIMESELEAVFEAFYTVDQTKENMGLGLHIVNNVIVHQMHGTIRCESNKFGGLSIIIELPCRAVA